MKTCLPVLFAAVGIGMAAGVHAADATPFADFEGESYGLWKIEGGAFGGRPAPGTLPGQMAVTGFSGKGLANSYHGGDNARGRLRSPDFPINRKFIAFLIGGGGHAGKTCMNLIVDGQVVRTATGPNTQPGGSEQLAPSGWDVSDLAGKTARIEIVDDADGGWGHINVDDIRFTDTKPPRLAAKLRANVERAVVATHRWLHFPVQNGATKRLVTVRVDGKVARRFEVELADEGQPDWWAPLDVGAWRGKTLAVSADQLPEGSRALEQITQGDTLRGAENLYREPLRSQYHFSARRGWLNDPNGLVFYNGEYHLFFQHNPYGWNWGNMHWGHATSRDLVRWTEHGEALYPDDLGPMFSGSAVVDWKNTSGFGKDGRPPLVLIYTAAGDPSVQCIAYSNDGRTFTKYAGNPVVKNIAPGDRDPKVVWHEPTKRWVMVLYVEKEKRHTAHLFTSPNLRDWTLASVAEGKPDTAFLFECPDLFELPLDGDASRRKWVLTGANSEYAVGTFDGTTFIAETANLPGHRGRGFYAAQTYSDVPDGRRIQIGWFQTPTPGMPFNQSMSLPLHLRLVGTPDGPRLTWTPVKELESLRARSHTRKAFSLAPGGANPLASVRGELLEIRAEFGPGGAGEIAFTVRGVPVVFDAVKQEIVVNGHRAPAPLPRDGKQRVAIFADRAGLEVFASDGLTFVPMPVNLKPEDQSLSVSARGGGAVAFSRLDVHELRSAWGK